MVFNMLEENLVTPFETSVLGVVVSVTRLEVLGRQQIVAICMRERIQQAIPILDVPLPAPPPAGSEWIAAYRRWVGE